jgi:hypothetical protein
MEAATSSKKMVNIYWTRWLHIPEDCNVEIFYICSFSNPI